MTIANDQCLLFIDVETMGLAPDSPIVELGMILVDAELKELAEAEWVVPRSQDEWVLRCAPEVLHMHSVSGLMRSSVEAFDASASQLLAREEDMPQMPASTQKYVLREFTEQLMPGLDGVIVMKLIEWGVKPKMGVIAGASVHMDRSWVRQQLPRLHDYLHYRMVDVSSIRELVGRWLDAEISRRLKAHSKSAEAKHRALDDARFSLGELRYYRDHIFAGRALPPFEMLAGGG